jgi:hypothetical protein
MPLRKLQVEDVEFSNLLNPADLAKLREEVQVEIKKEQAASALKEVRKLIKQQEQHKLAPKQELVMVTIDVPAAADGLLIDGVQYRHGDTVEVPRHMAASMREAMQNAWFAEKLAGNPNMKNYIPPRTSTFSALSVGLSRI